MTDTEPGPTEPETVMTIDQQQRQDALYTARSVIENRNAGGLFSKPGGAVKVESFAALVSIAHFITTGDREYVVRADERIDRPAPDPVAERTVTLDEGMEP